MKTKILRFCCILCLLFCIFNVATPTVYALTTTNGDIVVYVTATGNKYHRGDCGHLRSKFKTTLLEAVIDGYGPCEHCEPPIYIGVIPTETTEATEPTEKKSTGNGSSGSSGKYYGPNRLGRTDTAKTNSSTTKASSSNSSGNIAGVILMCVVLGPTIIYLIFILVLLPLWCLWEKAPVHKRLLLYRKKKSLQKQLIALSARYDAFIDLRLDHGLALHIIWGHIAEQILKLEDQYQCKADSDCLPVNKEAPTIYSKYGKDFTVTIGHTCYHRPTCRHATLQEYHVLKIGHHMKPCKQCHPPRAEAWMRRYVELHKKQKEINEVLAFPYHEYRNGEKAELDILDTINQLHQRIGRLPKIKK